MGTTSLADLKMHNDAFEAALSSGDADLEQATETVVHDDLNSIQPMVLAKMNANKPLTEKICTSSGFDVSKEAPLGPVQTALKPAANQAQQYFMVKVPACKNGN